MKVCSQQCDLGYRWDLARCPLKKAMTKVTQTQQEVDKIHTPQRWLKNVQPFIQLNYTRLTYCLVGQ